MHASRFSGEDQARSVRNFNGNMELYQCFPVKCSEPHSDGSGSKNNTSRSCGCTPFPFGETTEVVAAVPNYFNGRTFFPSVSVRNLQCFNCLVGVDNLLAAGRPSCMDGAVFVWGQ
jgi:hypothetical protein